MYTAITVGQWVDVNKAESRHCATHRGRLTLRSFQECLQPVQHRGDLVNRWRHVVHDLLVAHHLADEHGRLAHPEMGNRCPIAQDFPLQLGQRGIAKR
jgi:hypothetical protein